MKRIILTWFVLLFFAFSGQTVFAQDSSALPDQNLETGTDYQEPVHVDEIPPDQFYRAEVIEVVSEDEVDAGSNTITTQILKVRFVNGDLEGKEQEIANDGIFTFNGGEPLKVGSKVLVYVTSASGSSEFYIADTYRVPALGWMVLSFLVLAVVLSRWKGVASIFGLGISILVIVKFVVPQIIDGKTRY